MLEQEFLREQFCSMLIQQKKAAAGYICLAENLSDPVLREEVEQLRREKQRHIRLTERLLEIVE